MPQVHALELNADYFQLYIYDAHLDLTKVEIGADWCTKEDHQRMFSIKEGNRYLVMSTFRNFLVPVEVLLFEEKPPIHSMIEWDQINECAFYAESGAILIRGLGNEDKDGLTITTKVQSWRVRLYYGGQATIDEMGIDGNDRYRIELWPTESTQPPDIIKQNSYYLT